MNLHGICKLLDAKVLAGQEYLDRKIETCCGSDMMSDVLAFTKSNTLLCTGLTNMQVVRTAGISDLSAVVFVRGKVPDTDILSEAEADMLPVLSTEHTLFEACGILYNAGLHGCSKRKE